MSDDLLRHIEQLRAEVQDKSRRLLLVEAVCDDATLLPVDDSTLWVDVARIRDALDGVEA